MRWHENSKRSEQCISPNCQGNLNVGTVKWFRGSDNRYRDLVVSRESRSTCNQISTTYAFKTAGRHLRRGRGRLGAVLGRHFANPIMHYSLL